MVLSLCVAMALVSPAPARAGDDTPEPPIPLPGSDAFRTRETDHFLIWYDTSYDALRPLVDRVEGTYDAVVRVGRVYGFPMDHAEAPLAVIFTESHADFSALAARVNVDARGAAGFYDPVANVSIFGNILDSPSLAPLSKRIARLSARIRRSRNGNGSAATRERSRVWRRDLNRLSTRRDAIVKRFNRVVIRHEAAHHVLFNLGVHRRGADNPPWLAEGLAMQFEVAQTDLDGRIGRINQLRLGDLRSAAGIDASTRRLADDAYGAAFSTGALMPLTELIAGDPMPGVPTDRVTAIYAQCWGLVYYLTRTQEAAFAAYLRAVASRRPGIEVAPAEEVAQFTRAFGAPDESFQQRWLDYIIDLPFKPMGH